MKSNFNIIAIKMPTAEQVAAGEAPYVLMRWPRKVELPTEVQKEMKEKGITAIPTVSMNIPYTGAAVAKFLEIQNGMSNLGKLFALDIEFDMEEVRLTGSTKFYLTVNPTAINLNKVVELEPKYQGGEATAESDALAKLYNEAIRAAATARIAARATPSGTVVPGDVVPTETVPFEGAKPVADAAKVVTEDKDLF